MEKLNELSFERLRLVDEYISLSKQVNSFLTTARLSFSKAKTLHGVTLTHLAQPDSLNLVASVRVEEGESYSIIEDESNSNEVKERKAKKEKEEAETKESEKDSENKKSHDEGSFRPFGVLEPTVAKEGRKTMHAALKILCDMATVQRQIRQLDAEMESAAKEAKGLDKVEKLVECLKL